MAFSSVAGTRRPPIRLLGGRVPDDLEGDIGNDLIRGRGGDDLLAGNDGDDIILGGAGQTRLRVTRETMCCS